MPKQQDFKRTCQIARMQAAGKTNAQIGAHFGVSRQRVLTILNQAKKYKEEGVLEKMEKKPKDWLTIEECRKYAWDKHGRHWARAWIHTMVKTGKLPSFKVGATRIFKKSDVDICAKKMTKGSPRYPENPYKE